MLDGSRAVARVVMGRDERVEAMLAEVAPALLGYFVNRVDARADAADLVSETLATVWRQARRVPEQRDESEMWVFGVARNVLRNHERGTRRRDALAARLRTSLDEATIAEADELAELREIVASLPPDLAELVRLVYWDGFTIEDAARHLGIPPSTARGRHQRAKAALRDRLVVAL